MRGADVAPVLFGNGDIWGWEFLFVQTTVMQTTVMPYMQLAFMSQTLEFTSPVLDGDAESLVLTPNATCSILPLR